MAPASGFQPFGWSSPGVGAEPSFRGVGAKPTIRAAAAVAAVAIALLLAACGEDPHATAPAPPPPAEQHRAADPAEGSTSDLDGVAPSFSDAVLAELEGDTTAARAGFERVLNANDAPPPLAARAALHLAQMETRAGKNPRHALDLVARATTLAPGDAAVAEGVAQVEADVVAASGAGDIRGPKLGTPLPGVDAKVADAFSAADQALVRVHAIRPRQRLDVWAKEDATEDVAARYRAVAEHGGLARIAATFRIGSLYHDLALGLLFELPPGLAPSVAGELRRTLRTRALAYLKKAAAAYEDCLAAPKLPEAELWQLAAESELRSARDVLGAEER